MKKYPLYLFGYEEFPFFSQDWQLLMLFASSFSHLCEALKLGFRLEDP